MVSSSSVSAMRSIMCSRAASAASTMFAGIGSTDGFAPNSSVKIKACMANRSITPAKLSSLPMGN